MTQRELLDLCVIAAQCPCASIRPTHIIVTPEGLRRQQIVARRYGVKHPERLSPAQLAERMLAIS